MMREVEAAELASKAIGGDSLFILDVRNEEAFRDWKVEGEGFRYLNVPYYDLIDGVENILDRLPADEDILVVCAKEGSSRMIAEMLDGHGRQVGYLKGGMKAWSEHLVPLKVGDLAGGGELFQFNRIGKGCLSYMAISGDEAALFDATRMTEVYLDFAKRRGVQIRHVFDTHLHADHISGGRSIAEAASASYWLPPKDAEQVLYRYEPLEPGLELAVGSSSIRIEALETPGHTIGSMSFIIDGSYLLTGDILFVDSIGRPDLAGSAQDWVGDLRETLYVRYRALSEELLVLPAHFMVMEELNADGTVSRPLGELLRRNHGLNVKDEQEFRSMVTEQLPPQPNAYQEIRQTNMGRLQPGEEQQREMEIGPNRCAVR
ncbi:MBL fold metallo-hydrolase [Paenibacillus albicereus]|uniref:MBL fold metallo-hydrolase n=1 Tax=Paenibacillus albicereus TaxID=2726185 RepID=A0A6H2H0N8_9BACL|nr:MBL fold metallo-hydrolase [Paenibacillus albicereus]QJC53215.1 MBL fold metallo-hydrolase [Paenibacillus albicereus]